MFNSLNDDLVNQIMHTSTAVMPTAIKEVTIAYTSFKLNRVLGSFRNRFSLKTRHFLVSEKSENFSSGKSCFNLPYSMFFS